MAKKPTPKPAPAATADKPAKAPHYLLVARHTEFRLIGPFRTQSEAARWGHRKKNNPSDDPRWQTIQLADAKAPVRVVAPDQPMPAHL